MARGIVVRGSRASSPNSAVASKPMNAVATSSRPIQIEPPTRISGLKAWVKASRLKPVLTSTDTAKASRIRVSRTSATPSTAALTWMPARARRKTTTNSTTAHRNQFSSMPNSAGSTTAPVKKPIVPSAPATKKL